MTENVLLAKDKIFSLLVNMNNMLVKQKLENYGLLEEASNIKVSCVNDNNFASNNASISNEIKINDIEINKTKNQFRKKLKKSIRIEVSL